MLRLSFVMNETLVQVARTSLLNLTKKYCDVSVEVLLLEHTAAVSLTGLREGTGGTLAKVYQGEGREGQQ